MNKWIWIGLGIAVLGGFLIWLFIASSKPLSGEKIADLGRDHIEIGKEVEYNSNPPTSGPHFADWIRAGIYENPKDDRNLVHSLEHGYVIMSYNCDKQWTMDNGQWTKKKFSIFNFQFSINAYAHGIEEEGISGEATDSGELSDAFRSEQCHKLVDQLISVYEKKGKKKLIIVPRPNLDTRIALTAWDYLDKFDQFDEGRIIKFIDAYLNQGPEKTVE